MGYARVRLFAAPMSRQATTDVSDPLAAALGFDAGDLRANRSGELSRQQRERFAAGWAKLSADEDKAQAVFRIVGAAGLIASIGVAIIVGLSGGEDRLKSVLTWVVIAFTWGVVLALGFGKMVHSPTATPLSAVEGSASLSTEEGVGWGDDYDVLRVAGLEFQISKKVRAAFVEGRRYRCYYLAAAAPNLISAELISVVPH